MKIKDFIPIIQQFPNQYPELEQLVKNYDNNTSIRIQLQDPPIEEIGKQVFQEYLKNQQLPDIIVQDILSKMWNQFYTLFGPKAETEIRGINSVKKNILYKHITQELIKPYSYEPCTLIGYQDNICRLRIHHVKLNKYTHLLETKDGKPIKGLDALPFTYTIKLKNRYQEYPVYRNTDNINLQGHQTYGILTVTNMPSNNQTNKTYSIIAYDKDYDLYDELVTSNSFLYIKSLAKIYAEILYHPHAIFSSKASEPYDWLEIYVNFNQKNEERLEVL